MVLVKDLITLRGRMTATMVNIYTGKRKVYVKNNLIMKAGLNAIIRRLVDNQYYSNEGMITYIGVGDGTSTPVNTQTTLDNEIARVQRSYGTDYNTTTMKCRAFFTSAEANFTITEAACFGEEATSSVDTGTMFNRVNGLSIAKTSAYTLTIQFEWVFDNA